jgi:hypothetical protein
MNQHAHRRSLRQEDGPANSLTVYRRLHRLRVGYRLLHKQQGGFVDNDLGEAAVQTGQRPPSEANRTNRERLRKGIETQCDVSRKLALVL